MDAAVFGVLGLLTAVLVGAGVRDAVRAVRRRGAVAPAPAARRPRQVVLVRHGQTEWSTVGKHTGRTDVPLTDAGRVQAKALGASLAGWRFDAILVSPLGRARETLALLDRAEPVIVLDELQEWDYGDDEGRTTDEIREERPGWTVWDGPKGGESLQAVGARARRALAAAEGDVLVVAHGHVLRVLAACWLGIDPSAGRFLALDPATISVLGYEREQPVLRTWNAATTT